MGYKFCYNLIRTLCYVVGDRLDEATHRFLVIRRHASVPPNQHLFVLGQIPNRHGGPHACYDVKDVQSYSVQGFQITSIRAPLVTLIAALGITGYAANLCHFFLFEAQTTPFFAQAFARTHIWEFSR
ncbi:hypothetical protein SAMN05216247_10474 [Pseudomonas salomonii]|uniref:Uncharacterized protein n=1 Tax=Pseudomonas salomonii TaxID=191391 RepID=A0A1H3KEU7_9PSED|nr:hypothetical protein SAMN05216247_10474 [Pseudomonas salomonii]